MAIIAVLAVLAAVGGIAAIRTGWTLPWLRTRILRPRLWGYGNVLASICLVVQLTVGVFFAGSDAEFAFGFSAGVLMGIGCGGFSWAASRPGRAS